MWVTLSSCSIITYCENNQTRLYPIQWIKYLLWVTCRWRNQSWSSSTISYFFMNSSPIHLWRQWWWCCTNNLQGMMPWKWRCFIWKWWWKWFGLILSRSWNWDWCWLRSWRWRSTWSNSRRKAWWDLWGYSWVRWWWSTGRIPTAFWRSLPFLGMKFRSFKFFLNSLSENYMQVDNS